MQAKQSPDKFSLGAAASQFAKNKDAISKLANSSDAKKLMELLQQQGTVQDAAKAAAAGNTSQLMNMMNQLMSTKEGADLVDRIGTQAKQAGLE